MIDYIVYHVRQGLQRSSPNIQDLQRICVALTFADELPFKIKLRMNSSPVQNCELTKLTTQSRSKLQIENSAPCISCSCFALSLSYAFNIQFLTVHLLLVSCSFSLVRVAQKRLCPAAQPLFLGRNVVHPGGHFFGEIPRGYDSVGDVEMIASMKSYVDEIVCSPEIVTCNPELIRN
jgi:hypothetical protein